MAEVTPGAVKSLREKTGAGMMECKKALQEAGGNEEQAIEILRKRGMASASKKAGRVAAEGVVGSYIHMGGKVGVLVEVNCETDFVARTEEFKNLVKEIALHIASAAPLAVDKSGVPTEAVERERRVYEQQARESGKPDHLLGKIVEGKLESYYKEVALLSQPWIREPKKTIADLIKETSAKLGENIVVRRFARFQLGQE